MFFLKKDVFLIFFSLICKYAVTYPQINLKVIRIIHNFVEKYQR